MINKANIKMRPDAIRKLLIARSALEMIGLTAEEVSLLLIAESVAAEAQDPVLWSFGVTIEEIREQWVYCARDMVHDKFVDATTFLLDSGEEEGE
jgi:hypothetical protein